MLKTLAVVRTIFLVFIVGFTVRGLPLFSAPRTFDEQYALCAQTRDILLRASWFAIGWIFLETVIGWWLATRKPRTAAPVEASVTPPPPLR
jgi:hypothetical protein